MRLVAPHCIRDQGRTLDFSRQYSQTDRSMGSRIDPCGDGVSCYIAYEGSAYYSKSIPRYTTVMYSSEHECYAQRPDGSHFRNRVLPWVSSYANWNPFGAGHQYARGCEVAGWEVQGDNVGGIVTQMYLNAGQTKTVTLRYRRF